MALEARSRLHRRGLRVVTIAAPARLSLLNGFQFTAEGRTLALPMVAQRLLAFLALQDRSLPRLYVAGTLWAETTEENASANLRSTLWRIHQLGHRVVEASRTHVGLAPHIQVDVRELRAQASRLIDHSRPCEPADLDQASLLGDLLPGWYEDWVVIERERVRQLRLDALEALCQRFTAAGMHEHAVQAGLAAVAAEPLRESAQRVLIRAHLARGNRVEALRQYLLYRGLLFEQLGVLPSPEMEELVGDLGAPARS